MTLILKLDLDSQDVPTPKNEVSMSTGWKVIAQTDKHTHTETDIHTHRQYENITSTAYAAGNNFVPKG